MDRADEEIYGDWAVCQGPQPYYWGGTWLALGGQNPYACFAETAAAIKVRKAFVYDQGCEEEIQNAFADYFDGSIDLDTAKDHFEAAIKERYPEITRVVWP